MTSILSYRATITSTKKQHKFEARRYEIISRHAILRIQFRRGSIKWYLKFVNGNWSSIFFFLGNCISHRRITSFFLKRHNENSETTKTKRCAKDGILVRCKLKTTSHPKISTNVLFLKRFPLNYARFCSKMFIKIDKSITLQNIHLFLFNICI